MAGSARPLGPSLWLGAAVAVLVLALTLGAFAAVVLRAGAGFAPGPQDWAALRFTLLQATLSAFLSVAIAVPVARAVARRRFPGRGLLITLFGAPFILPVVVAVLGLLAVFGRAGLFNSVTGLFGLPAVSVYGLHGVVIAHVFFNLPLATRIILQGWVSIPSERFRLAASLGFAPRDLRKRLEVPMLREVLPGVTLLIFLVCLTSFSVALILGGGPAATTLELGIYQAFRFDFDLGRAAMLAGLQFMICGVAAALSLAVALPSGIGGGLDRTVERWEGRNVFTLLWDVAVITVAAAFLLLPLAMVVLHGAPYLWGLHASVWQAAIRSLLMAGASTVLTLGAGLALALASLQWGKWVEAIGMLALAASPLVIGTGLFILLFPLADPARLALPLTALINAVMALPFALRILLPELRAIEANYGRLAGSLNLTGSARLRILILPRLRRPLGFTAGLTAALSMGDLGVVALFADPDAATLPMQVFRLMGAYRMEEAAGAALLLLILSLALFWICDRGGRVDAEA